MGPTDDDYWAAAREVLADKDAEIARLRRDLDAALDVMAAHSITFDGLVARPLRAEQENARLRALLEDCMRLGLPDGYDLATLHTHSVGGEGCVCYKCETVREQQDLHARIDAALTPGEGAT